MPTLNEIINRLETLREVMKTGEVDFVVCVGGEDGFTTRNTNIVYPVRLIATDKPCAAIACWREEIMRPIKFFKLKEGDNERSKS